MTATVLVVEDETLVRLLAVDALGETGFQVLEAFDAQDAIRVLERQGADVQVLLTDFNLPGRMDGRQLAYEVRRQWPWIRLLVMSGRFNTLDAAELPAGARFLAKPFSVAQLVDQVRGLV